jgi:hypothetical protein
MWWGTPATAQVVSDTTPPQLTGISFAPATINVSAGTAAVVVTATITDNLAGTNGGTAVFDSPSGAQVRSVFISRIAGDSLNGTYRGTLTIPQFAESGVWKLRVILSDLVGNTITLTAANLQTLAFPTDLTVMSVPDTEAPIVTGIDLSPVVIDLSSSPQDLRVALNVTDNLTGFTPTNTSIVFFRSPSGGQQQIVFRNEFTLTAGTVTNGTWQALHAFPQFGESGTWTISSLRLVDFVGNVRTLSTTQLRTLGLQTDFQVVASPTDTSRPQVTGLTFDPMTFDTSNAAQDVVVRVTIADDLAGTSFSIPGLTSLIQFRSQSGQQFRNATNTQFTRVAGTPLNGVWQATVNFPRFSEGGTWTAILTVRDAVTNTLTLTTAQLLSSGFPSQVTIAPPPGAPDGVIGAAGGTVIDDDFGNRASLIVSPLLFPGPIDVAIDVLSEPPGLPTPASFTEGTLFVNISLNPVPPMPFAAPGVTLVLPFSIFRVPGSSITLFRLDEETGNLVPAPRVGGGIVTGTVNADGLSATFNGIARLSTLVGFFPTAVLGDVDGDGFVTCADMAIVRTSFGRRTGQPGFDARADLNRNGVVEVSDLALVSSQLPTSVVCR